VRGPIEFIPTVKRYPEVTLELEGVPTALHYGLLDFAANHSGEFPAVNVLIRRKDFEDVNITDGSILATTEDKATILGVLHAQDILNKIGYGYELQREETKRLGILGEKEDSQPFLRRFRFLLEE